MRMVCPACSAAYEVPESMLAPGRAVRCARCGNEWVPVAVPPPSEPPRASPVPSLPEPRWPDAEVMEEVEVEPPPSLAPETPQFTAMDRLALHRASVADNPFPLRIAWIATLFALLGLVAAAWVWRAELMHVWPASQRLYHALGVMQTPSGKP